MTFQLWPGRLVLHIGRTDLKLGIIILGWRKDGQWYSKHARLW